MTDAVRLLQRSPGTSLDGIRTDIEGLRAIAILLVVAYHAGVPGFSGGFIGVDVFFVLSGYLITGLLVREFAQAGRIDLVRFYGRRAKRLLPASALVLLATLVAGRLIFSPIEMKQLGATGLATALYASNLYFIRQSTDYQAGGSHDNPLLHTWSLAVEEQFYLLWPLIILVGATLVMRARAGNRLPLVLGGVALVSFAASLWLTRALQPWAFFGSPLRAWEFAAGGLAALAPGVPSASRSGLAGGWLGVAAIGAGTVAIGAATPFPGLAALLPVAGTALVLVVCAVSPGTGVGAVLAHPALQFTGRVSYSWYLWHWPVLVFAGRLGLADSLAARLGLVVLSLGLAVATFHLIENPLRYNRALIRRPALALGVAACLTLVVGAASGGFRLQATRVLASPEQVALAAARDTRAAPATCMLGYLDVDRPVCEFGDTLSATTVVLFGDSHATQWLSALERVALERGWRIRLAAKGDCPATMVDVWSPVLRRPYEECSEWRRTVLARIAEWRPDVVFIASTHVYPLRPAAFRVTLDHWREGLRRVIDAIEPSGARIVLLRDTPRPGFEVPECLSRAAFQPVRGADSCVVSSRAAIDTVVFAVEREALRSTPAVLHVDLTHRFCDDSNCPTVIDGIVVYKDTNHMTAAFSASLAGPLSRALGAAVPTVTEARGSRQD